MRKMLRIFSFVTVIILLSLAAMAFNAPEITDIPSVRTKEPVGLRVKAVVDEEIAMQENFGEYGFIVTRKFLLEAKNIESGDFSLDSDVRYTKGISRGVVDGESVDRFFDRNDEQTFFACYVHGIMPKYYTDVLVVRPYAVVADEVLYGNAYETSLYKAAKTIYENNDVFEALTDEQKSVICEIIDVCEFDISFYSEGELFCRTSAEKGGYASTPTPPEKEGYTFKGWAQSENGEAVELSGVKITQNTSFYALFEINKYTVTFTSEGEIISTQTVEYKSGATAPTAPAVTGHTFKAWANEDGESVDIDSFEITRDITFTALFTKNKYNINFYAGDVLYAQKEAYYMDECPSPDINPEKADYTFIGWATAPTESVVDLKDVQIIKNYNFYAIFEKNEFDVTFYVGDSVYYTQVVQRAQTATAPLTPPRKEGYTFEGWTFEGGTKAANLSEHPIKEDTAFYALFKRIYYTVTFYDGTDVYFKQSIAHGDKVNVLENPSKEGHDFIGWSSSDGGPLVDIYENKVTENTDFYAVFEKHTFAVRFFVDGNLYYSQTVGYKEKATLPKDPEKYKYQFKGWIGEGSVSLVDVANLEITRETELHAMFELVYHTVTFYVDGNEYDKQSIVHGEYASPVQNPEKYGYTFGGWKNEEGMNVLVSELVVKEDMSLYAEFERIYHTVTFLADGYSFTSFSVARGEAAYLFSVPSKVGYAFCGWSLDGYDGEITEVSSVKVEKDITFYAVFERVYCDVKFYVDGSLYNSQSVGYGDYPTVTAPKKTGYIFVGWSYSDGGEALGYVPRITQNTNFYAVFTEALYTVTFHSDGEVYYTQTVSHGKCASLTSIPTKTGYEFAGWAQSENGEAVELDTLAIYADTDLYAVFERVYHSVSFYANGELYDTQVVAHGECAAAPENPEKEGCAFRGWMASDRQSTVNVDTYPITDSITFNAIFDRNVYTVSYYVDGELYKTYEVAHGSVATIPEEPQKIGFSFEGWSESEGGEIVDVANSVVTAPVTYYAVFERALHTVIFYVDGEVYRTQLVLHDATPEKPQDPEKEGSTFVGWVYSGNEQITDIESFVVTEDAVFTAEFERQLLNVTFYVDGELYDTQNVYYNDFATLPEEPVKDGYAFCGWALADGSQEADDVSGIVITENTSFYAVFKKQHTVTFIVQDEEYDTQKVIDDEYPVIAVQPEIIGYDFICWEDADGNSCSPEEERVYEDTVYYARFEENINGADFVEKLSRGTTQLSKIRANGTRKEIIKLIADCLALLLEDAQNGLLVDKDYVREQYGESHIEPVKTLVSSMTDSEKSSFANLIKGKVDDDIQDFFIDYFDIDMSAYQ